MKPNEIEVGDELKIRSWDDMVNEFAESIKYSTIILTTVPVLCIYPFLQKYFVKGVMVGAVKG